MPAVQIFGGNALVSRAPKMEQLGSTCSIRSESFFSGSLGNIRQHITGGKTTHLHDADVRGRTFLARNGLDYLNGLVFDPLGHFLEKKSLCGVQKTVKGRANVQPEISTVMLDRNSEMPRAY